MWKMLVVILSVAVVVPRIYTLMLMWGFHKSIYNHLPGKCHLVEGIGHGSEDMELLPDGKVIITSGLVMDRSNSNFATRNGKIFMYDFTKSKPLTQFNVDGIDMETFNPHGITSWHDNKTGNTYVYVISHPPDNSDVVEKFLLDSEKGTLSSVKRIGRDMENIRMVNDLVAVGEDQFYYTNYMHYHSMMEQHLQLYWGSVGYYDGQQATLILKGLLMPNGINVSPDRKYLYLAHISERALLSFEIQPDNSLKKIHKEIVNTAADNIFVSPDTGDLLVGCHPVGYRTMLYMHNSNFSAPSQVLRVQVSEGRANRVTEVLVDDGEYLSGSTVAVRYKEHLLVGTIHTNMMHCHAETIP